MMISDFKRWVRKSFSRRSPAVPLVRPSKQRFVRPRVELLEDRIVLSTLTVTNPLDVAVAGELSLRQALVTANADAAAGTSDTIVFDPSLGSATISLTQGPLVLSGAGAGTIIIDGSAPSTPLTLDGINNTGRIFQINSGVQTDIQNLILQKGNASTGTGGAILNNGTLSLSNANLLNNSAASGGAIENTGTLTLNNDVFTGNGASSNAGGALDSSGSATVIDCTLSSNSASSGGGGAISSAGTLIVSNSTFTSNTAGRSGAAINSTAGSVRVTGGYFYQNKASGTGGAIESLANLNLTGSILSTNHSSSGGQAIDSSGVLTVTGATLIHNDDFGASDPGQHVTRPGRHDNPHVAKRRQRCGQ